MFSTLTIYLLSESSVNSTTRYYVTRHKLTLIFYLKEKILISTFFELDQTWLSTIFYSFCR